MEHEDLKEIIAAVLAADVEEFSFEIGDVKVHLKRGGAPRPIEPMGAVSASSAVPAAATAAVAPASSGTVPRRSEPIDESLIVVKAPMVGTFYRAPAPDAPPFVDVGSAVTPTDTVCIIDVMKLMNEVRAGCRGRVVRICAENATLVEYGQPLVVIEPVP